MLGVADGPQLGNCKLDVAYGGTGIGDTAHSPLEMATVYHELGSSVSVVELMDQLIPGADKDLVTPLTKKISKEYEAIWLGTKVTNVEAGPDGLTVTLDATASKDKQKAPE